MAKKTPRPEPSLTQDLSPLRADCPHCGELTWADYENRRTVATLAGLTRLNLTVRRCHNPQCKAHLRPYRPEAEGKIALPRHEFGLDVLALVGALRYAEHKSVPRSTRPSPAAAWPCPSAPSVICWTATTSYSPSP